jgi:hypothetical protein
MTFVFAWNGQACLALTGGRVGPQVFPLTITTRSPINFDEVGIDFQDLDQAAAWHLTATAQRIAAFRGYPSKKLELETWVLGPNPDGVGRLQEWFMNESPYTDQRIFIHRAPRRLGKELLNEPIWEQVHAWYQIAERFEHWDELQHVSKGYLQDILSAYAKDRDAVETLMEDSGHPYATSRGFLDES